MVLPRRGRLGIGVLIAGRVIPNADRKAGLVTPMKRLCPTCWVNTLKASLTAVVIAALDATSRGVGTR